MNNPLLEHDGLPRFSAIKAEHIEPAIETILSSNRQALRQLLAARPPWPELIRGLEAMANRLSRAWSPVRHLNSVLNSEALRQAYESCI